MVNLENIEIKANLFLQNGIVKEELWQYIFVQLSQRMEHVAINTSLERVSHAQEVIQEHDEAFHKKFKPLLDKMPAFPLARMSCCLAAIQELTSAKTNPEALDDVLNFWELLDADMQLYIQKYPELYDGVNTKIERDFSDCPLQEEVEQFLHLCNDLKQLLENGDPWEDIFRNYIRAVQHYENILLSMI